MNDEIRKTLRRRRSWYQRRLRIQRTLVAVVAGALVAGACWQNAARHLSLPSWHASQILPDSFWARKDVRKDLALMAARSARPAKFLSPIPGVYPYSVVPGGVKDAAELRYAATRDYVVRRHYARFDFNHARLVRASEAREVYLSYRIRDTVYWTRRKIRLHLGELLLTDGKITARARCGNQISDTAKPEVSNDEPEEDVMDRPVAELEPGPSFPMRPLSAPADLPGGQPTPPKLFANNFFFPYVSTGLPIPSGLCSADDEIVSHHCRPKRHHKPPTVPEPSTMMLTASGLAFILWRYRKTARPTAA
ncbi:MAG: PEP-CTERM sorting domain-containing protein [Terriglobales bacterium]